jgi:O-Antigen ligase.
MSAKFQIGIDRFTLNSKLFLFTIMIISILPSGYVFGVPVKSILLLINLSVVILFFKKLSKNIVLFSMFLLLFLLLFLFFGVNDYGVMAVKEFQLMLIGILLPYVYSYFFKTHLSDVDFINLYTISVFGLFFIKGILFFLGVSTSFGEMAFQFNRVFDNELITMELPFHLFRIYLPTDLLASFYPFVYISVFGGSKRYRHEKVGYIYKVALFASFLIVVLSFSRYIIFVSMAGFLFIILSGDKKITYMFIIVVVCFFISFVFYDHIFEFIELRLNSSANDASDDIRFSQTNILLDLFYDNPFFGNGIGAYSQKMIRSELTPFSYEQQVLSFLPKFGLIGAGVILFFLMAFSMQLIIKRRWSVFCVLVLFILSGVFNPYLYSSNVMLIYLFIFIYGKRDFIYKRKYSF